MNPDSVKVSVPVTASVNANVPVNVQDTAQDTPLDTPRGWHPDGVSVTIGDPAPTSIVAGSVTALSCFPTVAIGKTDPNAFADIGPTVGAVGAVRSWAPVVDWSGTAGGSTTGTNHDDAYHLAQNTQGDSNLARCYLELHAKFESLKKSLKKALA